ncbi:MAG: dienelactone hydrolase family protein [Mycobacteriaceae bacterium]
MARNRSEFSALTRRGPHKVLRGDLGFAGIPGVLYTPASGFGLPGVAFGHDWLTDVDHYAGTCAHLASWGIVAAAPDTQRSPMPSVLTLGHDLSSTLEIISEIRLGEGQISVDENRLAVAGHGFGAAAAVFAAAGRPAVKAAAAVFPSITKPSAEAAAAALTMPGLVLATPDDTRSVRLDALEVSQNWNGSVLRVVNKAAAAELAEKRRLAGLLGLRGSKNRTQRTVRALLTGFLLYQLTGDKKYRAFADPEAKLPRTSLMDPDAPPVTHEDRIVALFR